MHDIQTLELAMTNMARDHGNTPLGADMSPYTYQTPDGVTIALSNNLGEGHSVTYNTLVNVTRGLMTVLILGRRYNQVAFKITEAGVHVGGGSIRISRQ